MRYSKVAIRQIPDSAAEATGLSKEKRSKMPGTSDFLQAAMAPNGRFITGIDEEGYDLVLVEDKELVQKLKEERKSLREALEKSISEDLSGTSKFWETFGVRIHSDQELLLNQINPIDVIKYHLLISNGYAAPSKEFAGHPEYRGSKYYCFVEEKEEEQDISTQKKRDQARSELYKLSENDELMLLIAQVLIGERIKKGMKSNTIYKHLSDYVNSVDGDNITKFLKIIKTPIEDLVFRRTIDVAVKKKIINFKEGYYQRGQVTLGRSINDVYLNLKKPEFATEFISIQEELE